MTILHLDRSKFFQKVVKEAGKLESVEYHSAVSKEEAWVCLRKTKVDLILTGQELEDGSIVPLLKELEKSDFFHIPVIVITSNDSLDIREKFFNLGVVDFIPKAGFSPAKLKEQLDYFKAQDEMALSLTKAPFAVLDDSKLSQNVVTSILKFYGIEQIDVYSDPQDLLDSNKVYHVYFVDLILPGMSGERIVREIRRRYPHRVIIVISSLEKYNTIVHVLESGADDYIIKPFDGRLLMARLKTNFRHFLATGELKKQSDQLKKMAVTDGLTGCRNHRYLMRRLESEVDRAERHHHRLSLLMLDLDKFKVVNDTYGHGVGDQVLKYLSKIFMDNCRNHDVFGRFGGEEFLLILPDTDLKGALGISERLRERFVENPMEGMDKAVTFSGGLVEWRGENFKDLLKRADELLYCAKNEGRNRIKTEEDPFCIDQ